MTVAEKINKEKIEIHKILKALNNCYYSRLIGNWYVEYTFADASVLEMRYYETSILTKVRK